VVLPIRSELKGINKEQHQRAQMSLPHFHEARVIKYITAIESVQILECKPTDYTKYTLIMRKSLLFKFVTVLLLIIDKIKFSERKAKSLKIIVSGLFALVWKRKEKKKITLLTNFITIKY
jgi:hypothetical protein